MPKVKCFNIIFANLPQMTLHYWYESHCNWKELNIEQVILTVQHWITQP